MLENTDARPRGGVDHELEPWEDPRVLDYLYNERFETFSTREIANDVFDGEVDREKIRVLLNNHGLMPTTIQNLSDKLRQRGESEYPDKPGSGLRFATTHVSRTVRADQ